MNPCFVRRSFSALTYSGKRPSFVLGPWWPTNSYYLLYWSDTTTISSISRRPCVAKNVANPSFAPIVKLYKPRIFGTCVHPPKYLSNDHKHFVLSQFFKASENLPTSPIVIRKPPNHPGLCQNDRISWYSPGLSTISSLRLSGCEGRPPSAISALYDSVWYCTILVY